MVNYGELVRVASHDCTSVSENYTVQGSAPAGTMFKRIGEFLPSCVAELVPGLDLVPLWTLAVVNVYRKWKRVEVIRTSLRVLGGWRRDNISGIWTSESNGLEHLEYQFLVCC
jgi:hypothetical protein